MRNAFRHISFMVTENENMIFSKKKILHEGNILEIEEHNFFLHFKKVFNIIELVQKCLKY
jgi:hypothetical protein